MQFVLETPGEIMISKTDPDINYFVIEKPGEYNFDLTSMEEGRSFKAVIASSGASVSIGKGSLTDGVQLAQITEVGQALEVYQSAKHLIVEKVTNCSIYQSAGITKA